MAGYRNLEWDSDFFGKSIGKIEGSEHTGESLKAILGQARKDSLEVLYWFAKPSPENKTAAEQLNGFLADRKITYLRDLQHFYPMELAVNYFISSYKEPQPDTELNELALIAGEFSRFRKDPGFGQANFERLYLQWMENSVSRKIAEEVLYIEHFGRKVAVLTLGLKTVAEEDYNDSANNKASASVNNKASAKAKSGKATNQSRPDIGLVATATDHQGRGLAGDLVKSAIVWAVNRSHKSIQVVTQGENSGACAFYEKLGFSPEKTELVYHFWL